MEEFNETEVHKLAALCRIACTEEEKKKFSARLAKVIEHVATLNEIDTEGVETSSALVAKASLPLREDVEGPLLAKEAFLDNAPAHTGGMIRVPPIIKFTNS